MAAGGVRVEGAEALARALRQYPAASKKEMRKSNLQVSRRGREWARSAARSGTPLQSRMAQGIGAQANSRQAFLTVRNTASAPGATVAYFGTKRRIGWYAAARYRNSPPQFPPWVGNRWRAASRNEGPYAINAMLADRLGDLQRLYFSGQISAIQRAARAAG